MDQHAQHEIRIYATTIGEKIVSVWVPLVWEAFMDYRMRSIQLSRIEIEIISAISSNEPNLARELARKYGIEKLGRDGKIKPNRESLLQNSLGSRIYCREELLSLGARASRPHKTWQGRRDWLHRVGRFTRRLTLEQRLDKYAGGTPALPGGNPWLARCRSLSRALFCRSILPPSHARLRILQKARERREFESKGLRLGLALPWDA